MNSQKYPEAILEVLARAVPRKRAPRPLSNGRKTWCLRQIVRPYPRARAGRPVRGRSAVSPRWTRSLVREIARKGGRAAHSAGTAHEFTSEEARGSPGARAGLATHERRRRSLPR